MCVAPWIGLNHNADASVKRFRSLLALDQNRPGAAYGFESLGVYLRERGDSQGALVSFASALRYRPGYPRYLAALRSVVQSMPPKAARNVLAGLVSDDQTRVDLEIEIALIEAREGQTSSAIARLRRIVAMGNHVRSALIELAKVHLAIHDYAGAIVALNSVAMADQPDGEVEYLLGQAYLRDGRCADAIRHFGVAANSVGARDDVDYYLGLACRECGQLERSEALFLAYLAAHPSGRYSSVVREFLGW